MNTRIKTLRKEKHLTQVEFGRAIGVQGSTVTFYEKGVRIPSESVIRSICREFNVSRTWLETGEGDMFVPMTKSEEISEFVGDLLRTENDDFKKRLISQLAALDDAGWETLERFLDLVQKNGE